MAGCINAIQFDDDFHVALEAINAPRVWGRNDRNGEFEITKWKEGNSNILSELRSKGYKSNFFKERSWGHAAAIRMDQNSKMLHCGHDINRWGPARCVAVCSADAECALRSPTTQIPASSPSAMPTTMVRTTDTTTAMQTDTSSIDEEESPQIQIIYKSYSDETKKANNIGMIA
eukprot:486473_1